MTVVFSVFPDAHFGGSRIFPTLREARAYVGDNDLKDYVIERHVMVRPTVESMISIINSQGMGWSTGSIVVSAKGHYAPRQEAA